MKSYICGSIPVVIGNTEGLYAGNLIHYFRILFNHAQNLTLPYHNFRHMMHVTWQCYNACAFHRNELSGTQMRMILIAAMFHDFDHCGMAGHDDLNITRAIRGMEKHLLGSDKFLCSGIRHIIEATEFPHKDSAVFMELPELIIRDADMTQALDPAWIQEILFGLGSEWGKNPVEILRMQEGFLQKLKFNTRWAQETFPPEVIAEKIDECRQLLSFLEQTK